jgi:protein-S-isoprenylcysteine O-methyltransferase Ste14
MSADTQAGQSSIAALVQSAIADTQQLVRGQVELTKAELKASMKETANASGMFIAAGMLAFLGFVFILVAAAYGLNALTGWPEWSGFLIVAVFLVIVAGILAIVGRSHIRKVGPPARSIAAIEATKSSLTAARPTSEVAVADVPKATQSSSLPA